MSEASSTPANFAPTLEGLISAEDQIAVVLRAQPFQLVPNREGLPVSTIRFLRGTYQRHTKDIVVFTEETADGVLLEWRLALCDIVGVAKVSRLTVSRPRLTLD